MRVLMTNHFFYRPGGSETWTLTVARELERRGHQVEVFAMQPGLFAEASRLPMVTSPEGRSILHWPTTTRASKRRSRTRRRPS